MAFKVEVITRAVIDYKNCYGTQTKGLLIFNTDKEEVSFKTGLSENSGEKATMKVSDLRALVKAYDAEKAKKKAPKALKAAKKVTSKSK